MPQHSSKAGHGTTMASDAPLMRARRRRSARARRLRVRLDRITWREQLAYWRVRWCTR